ncbi:MAG: hypothetical protein C4560_08805 [Nitrospiraceae bacterium]|nr:MAG: hypothetical protein C4560_08805 [Nitrospiraceae bacterium]
MKYFHYLKTGFPLYIAGGAILGIAISVLVIIHRYDRHLSVTLDTMKNIGTRKEEIKKQIHDMDSLTGYLRDKFGITSIDINPESLVLKALDEMKNNFKEATITAAAFEEADGVKKLPVEIKSPVQNYKAITDIVGYVESFRLPRYSVRSISVSKEQAGGVILNIQGEFVAPLITAGG